jgi:hypothetical protein
MPRAVVTSSTRHYWLVDLIGVAFILPVGLLLRVPVEVLVVVAPLRSLAVALAHTNIRASYAFLSLVIAGPQVCDLGVWSELRT